MKQISEKLYQTNHVILHKEDILTDIISSIKAYQKQDLVIVVPENMKLFHHHLNVKILAKEILPLPYKVTFFSIDFEVIDLFRSVGLQASASQEVREDTFQQIMSKPNIFANQQPEKHSTPHPTDSFFLNLNPDITPDITPTAPEISSQLFPSSLHNPQKSFTLPVDSSIDELPKTQPKKDYQTSPRSPRKLAKYWIIGGLAIFFVIAAIVVLVPRATLEVVFEGNYLQKDLAITLDTNVEAVDMPNSILPAKIKSFSAESTGKLIATGESTTSSRARASVTIFNKTSASQPLVASTRLQTEDKIQFRLAGGVTIPARGSLEVEIIADGEGDEYNIQPGKLTLPGLASSPNKFENIFAELSQPITSGTGGSFKVVTQEDIQKFKDEMIKKITDEISLQVQQDSTENLKIVNTREILQNVNFDGLPSAGDRGDSFDVKATAQIEGIYYDNSQALQLATATVKEQVLDGQTLGESLSISFSDLNSTENGKYSSRMYIEYIIVDEITTEELRKDLVGKTFSGVQEYAKTFDYVSELNIYINPGFWPIMPVLGRNIEVKFVYP